MQSFAAKLVSLVLVWTALVLVMSPAQARIRQLDERGRSYIQRSSTPWSTLDKRGKRATACNCKVVRLLYRCAGGPKGSGSRDRARKEEAVRWVCADSYL